MFLILSVKLLRRCQTGILFGFSRPLARAMKLDPVRCLRSAYALCNSIRNDSGARGRRGSVRSLVFVAILRIFYCLLIFSITSFFYLSEISFRFHLARRGFSIPGSAV